MKFDDLLDAVGGLPWFELAMVTQLVDERRETVVNQLYRFSRAGKIISLRRGMYVFAERYRQVAVQPAELAGAMYRPSYLSDVWALGYYGLIPEGVPVHTSVTSRTPKKFLNAFGEYRYRSVKPSLFFGYEPIEMLGRPVMIATPEKALVDLWHLGVGEWTWEKMGEMRISKNNLLDMDRLFLLVDSIGKPRLYRAFEIFSAIADKEAKGEIAL
ncbi:MAG: hypothetical protein QNJ97_24845 [Myxococcota bacterium]|nr:hypothetical protein [Myxococcota bacterium]